MNPTARACIIAPAGPILGKEALPVDNLFFAGETTDAFCEGQGFMEGGANSGIRAANELLALVQ